MLGMNYYLSNFITADYNEQWRFMLNSYLTVLCKKVGNVLAVLPPLKSGQIENQSE